MINADGGGLRRLTHHRSNNSTASWSRDGRWIYFTSDRTGESQVWRMLAENGEAVQFTKRGGRAAVESPDGKFVYYARNIAGATSLWRMPVAGGDEEKVLDAVLPLQFTVVNSGIYFVGPTDRGLEIQFLSFVSGKVTSLAPVNDLVQSCLSVSPDGRFLLYSFGEAVGGDLMLVENFR